MKMSEKLNAKILNALEKWTDPFEEWPPHCNGLMYQPVRPIIDSTEKSEESK